MCGITGFVNFNGHDRDEASRRIRRSADAIVHRGPDEHGYFVDDHCAFGHRRLSIIDLSSGQQPMHSPDGSVHLIYNGEIYNYRSIRAELEAKGYQFRTQSDTEVIVLGYLEWQEHCIEKLNGMFAIALWDDRRRQLLLARDRVGKKPLYYCHHDGVLAFASELKSLRNVDLCPSEIDQEALDCYFTFGYIPTPNTIYKNVHKLPSAHLMVVTADQVRQRPYWSLSFADERHLSLDDACDELSTLFDDAVESRLVSEVPLGVFLSGGLDSTLVVSSMAKILDSPAITNSIGFGDKEFDELPIANLVADHLKTQHHQFVVKPEITDVLKRIAWHFDEPFSDSSAVPTWYVCEMARKNVTVALSGDGGDESFAGYSFRYIPHMLESKLRRRLPIGLRRLLFGPLGRLWPAGSYLPRFLRLKTIFENLGGSDAEAFYDDLIFLRSDTRKQLYTGDFLNALNGFTPAEKVQPLYNNNDAKTPLGRSQYTDIHFYMTDDVLTKVDRMSMAHSLEVRAPLLDYRILEFAARLPNSLKTDTQKGKLALRELAARRLPEKIQNLPKKGFSIPAASWLRGELKPFVEEVVFDNSRRIHDYLAPAKTHEIWKQHQRGQRDHSYFLWGLMMFGLWEDAHLKT